MKYVHRLLPLTPWRSEEEQRRIRLLKSVAVSVADGRTLSVSLLGDDYGVAAIACTLPNVSFSKEAGGASWTAKEGEWINRATKHMLSVVRLVQDPNIDCLKMGGLVFTIEYEDESPEPAYGMVLSSQQPRKKLNVDACEATFKATTEHESICELLAEAISSVVPIHYRFMTLYKIIELEHRGKTADFHSTMDEAFAALGLSTVKLKKLLPMLRAKIAHAIATGSDKPGLTALEQNIVEKLLPVMTDAIMVTIGERYGLTRI